MSNTEKVKLHFTGSKRPGAISQELFERFKKICFEGKATNTSLSVEQIAQLKSKVQSNVSNA